ncbi:MAG: hypothetical protein IBJ09_05825 [Bacteroidia bacterium]|nr:hypothetical protein [Bacteroidia bacterium]
MRKLYTLFILLSAGDLFAQHIPFRLTEHNNIAIQAVLNGRDTVQLMFHTAASELTLTEEAVQKTRSLQFTGSADSVKSWGGDAHSSRISEHNTLQIGRVLYKDIRIAENRNSGPGTDGKFGPDLFTGKVIGIDFDKGRLLVRSRLPHNIRRYDKIPLRVQQDMLFMEAGCIAGTDTLRHSFLVHSGYGGGILFNDTFAEENRLGEKLPVTGEKELRDSFGNVIKTKKALLPLLQIGRTALPNVQAGFFEGAVGRQKMSVLGGDVLKQFHIILDAERRFIYLRPNRRSQQSQAPQLSPLR